MKTLKKIARTGKEIIIEIVGWIAIELFSVGLAFTLYYSTKRSSLELWYLIGVPLVLGFLALIIFGIFKLIELFKKLKK